MEKNTIQKNIFQNNKAMKKIYFLILIITSTTFAQKSFDYVTNYKQNQQNNFVSENFSFTYNSKLKEIKFTDKDLNITQNLPVNYFDSSYTSSNEIYVISYYTDIEKLLLKNKKSFNFPSLFSFFFNKKLGKLIKVEVVYNSLDNDENMQNIEKETYYTNDGKDFLEKLKEK